MLFVSLNKNHKDIFLGLLPEVLQLLLFHLGLWIKFYIFVFSSFKFNTIDYRFLRSLTSFPQSERKKERKKVKSLSRVRLFAAPWTVTHQTPPSVGFSRQEYWSGLPFPSPGHLPDPGIEPRSPAMQADALLSEPPGKPQSKQRLSFFGRLCTLPTLPPMSATALKDEIMLWSEILLCSFQCVFSVFKEICAS